MRGGVDREALAAELAELDDAEAALVQHMADLCQVPGDQQHAALSDWARSDYWSAALMLLAGWQGSVARAAYDALRIDLAADTPGRRWDRLDPAVGRASILRLLEVEGHQAATYAAMPFRTWLDDDGRSWIAAAVGCRPVLDNAASLRWTHLDIRDVILWDPRTGACHVVGEHSSVNMFVMPDVIGDELTVWGDAGAFFKAWAKERSRVGQQAMAAARGDWAHPVIEPAGGGLAGALLVGDVAVARWPAITASVVHVGEGVTAGELHYAAIRNARVPVFRNH